MTTRRRRLNRAQAEVTHDHRSTNGRFHRPNDRHRERRVWQDLDPRESHPALAYRRDPRRARARAVGHARRDLHPQGRRRDPRARACARSAGSARGRCGREGAQGLRAGGRNRERSRVSRRAEGALRRSPQAADRHARRVLQPHRSVDARGDRVARRVDARRGDRVAGDPRARRGRDPCRRRGGEDARPPRAGRAEAERVELDRVALRRSALHHPARHLPRRRHRRRRRGRPRVRVDEAAD